MFGHPNHRLRSWRIVYNKIKKFWSSPYSFEQLACLVLAPIKCDLKLDSSAYLVALPEELYGFSVKEAELTRRHCQTELGVIGFNLF